jgi:hypothetical protein
MVSSSNIVAPRPAVTTMTVDSEAARESVVAAGPSVGFTASALGGLSATVRAIAARSPFLSTTTQVTSGTASRSIHS